MADEKEQNQKEMATGSSSEQASTLNKISISKVDSLSSPTVVIAAITFLAYFTVFQFENGYLSAWGLASSLIEIDSGLVLKGVFSVIGLFFCMEAFFWGILLEISEKKTAITFYYLIFFLPLCISELISKHYLAIAAYLIFFLLFLLYAKCSKKSSNQLAPLSQII